MYKYFSILYILITFLVRQVRCPQLVEGTFPLSYYSFDTLIKLLLLLLLLLSRKLVRHLMTKHEIFELLNLHNLYAILENNL